MENLGHLALLLAAAFTAGALNAVAGGGSFLTLPALVFTGVPPVVANATGTVGLQLHEGVQLPELVDQDQGQGLPHGAGFAVHRWLG